MNQVDSLLMGDNGGPDPDSQKKLAGLMRTDPYDPSDFSPSHLAFKSAHNDVFAKLAQYAAGGGAQAAPNVFYLDGSDGGTTRALRERHGFEAEQLYSANLFRTTVQSLCAPPVGLAGSHVYEGRAEDALAPEGWFGGVPMSAFYFDGCGGSPEPIITALEAALDAGRRQREGAAGSRGPRINRGEGNNSEGGEDEDEERRPPCVAVGFTLTLAEPTGRALSDREQDVFRALVAAARRAGYGSSGAAPAPVQHVGDEPARYGVDPAVRKRNGGTLTTWCVLGDHGLWPLTK